MKTLQKIHFPAWTVPIVLFVICGIAYLPFVRQMGYYWDDWSEAFIIRLFNGAEFWRFWGFTNRPSGGWTFSILGPLLGPNPLVWQVFAVLQRWLTAVLFWGLIRVVWPAARRPALVAAMIFAVYPVFTQTPIAMTYHMHWAAYSLYIGSLLAMVLAVRQPSRGWVWWPISILAMIGHLAVLEYFAGAELFRPVLLWLVLSDRQERLWRRIQHTAQYWLPFGIILAAFVIWRVFFQPQVENDPNQLLLIKELVGQPMAGLKHLATMLDRDLIFILASSWFAGLSPELVNLDRPFIVLVWVLVLVCAAAAALYLLGSKTDVEEPCRRNGFQDPRHWIWIGLLQILAAGATIWVTGRMGSDGGLQTRFVMSTMLGASLFWAGLWEWITPRWLPKAVLVGLMVGLAAGIHLRDADPYRQSWEEQLDYSWQLYWRAPAIQPQTAIFSDEFIFPYARRSFALNLLYLQPQNGSREMPYWHYLLRTNNPNVPPALFAANEPLSASFRGFTFQGNSQDSLVILFDPQKTTHCLWVLDPQDVDLPYFSDAARQMVPLSNPQRISAQPARADVPPQEIFGKPPQKNWCWYFEKADLAVQQENWAEAAALGDQALAEGYSPERSASDVPYEWLPFINGFAYVGRWQDALDLTLRSYQVDPAYQPVFCRAWHDLSLQTPAEERPNDILREGMAAMNCPGERMP